ITAVPVLAFHDQCFGVSLVPQLLAVGISGSAALGDDVLTTIRTPVLGRPSAARAHDWRPVAIRAGVRRILDAPATAESRRADHTQQKVSGVLRATLVLVDDDSGMRGETTQAALAKPIGKRTGDDIEAVIDQWKELSKVSPTATEQLNGNFDDSFVRLM